VHHCHHACHPNPSNGQPVHFDLGDGPHDGVDISIYTTGLRRVCHKGHRCSGGNEEEIIWDLMDDCQKMVANGLYFAVIDTTFNGEHQRRTEKVLILR
jgi:hypothetical protein